MNIKKLLSCMLAVILLPISMAFPDVIAYAEQMPDVSWFDWNNPKGTYYIRTADELAGLALIVNAGIDFANTMIMLEDDIDLNDYAENYNNGKGWIPIGTPEYIYVDSPPDRSVPFKGWFDGNGHTISGLYINAPEADGVGLFGGIKDGTVKNLGIKGADIIGASNVGGLVGNAAGFGGITNCYVTGSVSGGAVVGALVGEAFDGQIIENTYSNCTVNGNDTVGGLVGAASYRTAISNSYVAGTVNGNTSYIGGIAGEVYGGMGLVSSIQDCVVLSRRIKGTTNVRRIADNKATNSYPGELSGNYALADMVVTIDNAVNALIKGHDQVDGEDLNMEDAMTAAFWTETMGWDEEIWSFSDGRLPTLKNLDNGLITTTSKAVRINGNIALTVDTNAYIPNNHFIHVALYDNNKLVDYILVPILEEERALKHFYVVLKGNQDADYAKVFIWTASMEPVSIADRIPISEFE